jgi:hypothetical protein
MTCLLPPRCVCLRAKKFGTSYQPVEGAMMDMGEPGNG